MFKPLIGVVLSWFLLATLAGEVISIGFLGKDAFVQDPIANKTMYCLWILGFLTGFSERFAWDFVDRAEGIVAGGFVGGAPDKRATPLTTTDSMAQHHAVKRKHKKRPDGKSLGRQD
jgi:hypothetical protein